MKTKLTPLLPYVALLSIAAPVFANENAPAAVTENGYTPYLPKQYDISRYAHMRKKSPFEFEAPKEEVAAAADPFEAVSLAGYAGGGKMMSVYLFVGKEKQRVTVWGDASPMRKSDDSGFRIIGLKKGKSLASSEVILEKDGQQKPIKFEEDTLKNAKGGSAGGGGGGVQMVPGPNGTMVPRPVMPRPGGNAPNNAAPPAPFIPGRTPENTGNNNGAYQKWAEANGIAGRTPANTGNNNATNPGGVNPLNVQQGINNMTGQPSVTQPNVPPPPQTNPGSSRDGKSSNGTGRRRVVLPTQP